MANTLILFSSANQAGNTYQLTQAVRSQLDENHTRYFNLDAHNYADYNYQNFYSRDDFYDIADALAWADNIVFSSPVYWHSVTSNMKRLIDRITELTENSEIKHIGKGLKNKKGFVLTTSASKEVCPVFAGFFEKIFHYFEIEMRELFHINCKEKLKLPAEAIASFTKKLK
ncbi:FMN reductase [Pseudoalteromonas phenolica]|uniref:flavodoxin family protein n=1 Tax=Pseudoalteromonas phenolica TaxID=161398 RepID=UPI00110A5F2A|nr:NAD(P)H-dependent oxidoreductase [Pseudoalteromonas phenolica]TMN90069.1 FMN reductase [Pseudoalteromonas phenolica]